MHQSADSLYYIISGINPEMLSKSPRIRNPEMTYKSPGIMGVLALKRARWREQPAEARRQGRSMQWDLSRFFLVLFDFYNRKLRYFRRRSCFFSAKFSARAGANWP